MDHTNLEIEHIARAFYSARQETGDWEMASRVLKHEYRLYARQALYMLNQRQEEVQAEERKASPARTLENV